MGLISITLVIAARFIDVTDCLHNLKRSTDDDQTLYILFKRNIKWMCKQTIVRFIYYDNFIELKLELKQKISNWLKTHLHPTEFNLKIFPKGKTCTNGGRTDCAVAYLDLNEMNYLLCLFLPVCLQLSTCRIQLLTRYHDVYEIIARLHK